MGINQDKFRSHRLPLTHGESKIYVAWGIPNNRKWFDFLIIVLNTV